MMDMGGKLFTEQGDERKLRDTRYRFGSAHPLSSFRSPSDFRRHRSETGMNVETLNGRAQVATIANKVGTFSTAQNLVYGDR